MPPAPRPAVPPPTHPAVPPPTHPAVPPPTRRAAALPPDERREALIRATLPLVLAHGTDVSTRRIAAAAGVAEGTIFRVFASKDELLDAVVASAFDPSALVDGIARVDRAAPLADRLVAAVELMQERGRQLAHLLHALAAHRPPGAPADRGRDRRFRAAEARLVDALAALIEPDRDQLRRTPQEVARRLRAIAMALSHPRLVDEPLPAREIVSLLLDGMRVRPEPGTTTLSPAPGPIPARSIGVRSC